MAYDRSTGWLRGVEGVVTAVVTPFDEQGRVHLDAIGGVVGLQLDAGVRVLMVAGTTGEFPTLSEGERREVLTAYVEAVDGRARIIANVGHLDAWQAHRLAEHAASLGVDAVAAIAPYFFPVTPAASGAYFRSLARSIPDTGFLVYNFPRHTTNAVPVGVFEELLDEPNVAGAKCSVGSLEEIEPYLRLGRDVSIMCGNDRLASAFVDAGGRVIVSGNANAYPDLVVPVFARCLDGTFSPRDAALIDDISDAARDAAPDRLKALLHRRGIDGGTARLRTHLTGELDPVRDDACIARIEAALASFPSGDDSR